MKLGELHRIFGVAENIYRDAGNTPAADALKAISSLCEGRDTVTVAAFSTLVEKATVTGDVQQATEPTESSGSSTSVAKLRAMLKLLEQFCTLAGGKSAAKDMETFSTMLKPFAAEPVNQFCAKVRIAINQASTRPINRKKKVANPGAVREATAPPRHLSFLREAGTNRDAFDRALATLKSDKNLKLPDLAEIARQYSLSVTAYKSKVAAYSDIEKAFVRETRFENKLR